MLSLFREKYQTITVVILLAVYGFLLLSPINLFTADLGRHLRNGELFFQKFLIPSANLYSYTFPDFPFVNHHWLSGVVFFIIQKLFDFLGLSIFFVFLSLLTFYLFFKSSVKTSGFFFTSLISLLVIPLLASRREIRPEVFSYFFIAVFYYLLQKYQQCKVSTRILLLLPIIQIFWVNLHIYFPWGWLLIGVFLSEALVLWLFKKDVGQLRTIKVLGLVQVLTILASFINPTGLLGVIYPFRIFNNYGYRVLENQSLFFLEKIINYPSGLNFKIVIAVLFISWFLTFLKFRWQIFPRPYLSNLLLTIFITAAAFLAVRNFTLFGYFSLPVISFNLSKIFSFLTLTKSYGPNKNCSGNKIFLLLLFFWIVFLVNQHLPSFGWGLLPDTEKAVIFYKRAGLSGPIFNNYDVGSYLIYYLYPQEKVFVDNRPEAYPASFFDEIYIPLQENHEEWEEADRKYNFNTLFFYRHDLTPWGQKFLVERVKDASWAPIFVDDYVIIFVKRIEKNQSVIEKFELPREIFRLPP